MKKIFVGYTRFSLVDPGSKAWIVSQRNDYLEKLFSPKRLDDRFQIFFECSLPALRSASSKTSISFIHLFLYSEEIGINYKRIITEKCSQDKFLIPVEVKTGANLDIKKIIETKLNQMNIDDAIVGRFSLDDDDILSSDYFIKSQEYMQEPFLGKILSFGKGITGVFENGNFSSVREIYHPKVNIGMLYFCRLANGILNVPRGGNHMLVDQKSPLILDSRNHMFFWTRHAGQDTMLGKNISINSLVEQNSLISNDLLNSNFPTISNKILKRKTLFESNLNANINDVQDGFIISSHGRLFFKFSFECSEGVEEKSILAKFVFSDEDSKKLISGASKIFGVSISENKKIGFYRYIYMKKNVNHAEISVFVPDDFQEFEVFVINRSSANAIIKSFSLECDE